MRHRFGDIIDIVRISGLKGLGHLVAHSRHVKRYARPFAVMNSILALEKCDLNGPLLSKAGLGIATQQNLDPSTLSTICEYLYETGILARASPGVYKAKQRRQFEFLLQAMYACYAYHQPAHAMDRLLTKEYRYGRDVVRDDQYDALASAALTSMFSYGFSHRVLKTVGARSVLDLGCGTGQYLAYLRQHGFPGSLYGVDVSEQAISHGQQEGFEADTVRLLIGDIFDIPAIAARIPAPSLDVISFMFVLHEFEDEQVQRILKAIKDIYRHPRILLTELIARSSEEVRTARRSLFPELKFVHQLSRQILRTPVQWKRLFAASGFCPVVEMANDLTQHVCLLFSPESDFKPGTVGRHTPPRSDT